MSEEKNWALLKGLLNDAGLFQETGKDDESISDFRGKNGLGIGINVTFQNNLDNCGILISSESGNSVIFKDFVYPMSSDDVRKILEKSVEELELLRDIDDVAEYFEKKRDEVRGENRKKLGITGQEYRFINQREKYIELSKMTGFDNGYEMLIKMKQLDDKNTLIRIKSDYERLRFEIKINDYIVIEKNVYESEKYIEDVIKKLKEEKKVIYANDVINKTNDNELRQELNLLKKVSTAEYVNDKDNKVMFIDSKENIFIKDDEGVEYLGKKLKIGKGGNTLEYCLDIYDKESGKNMLYIFDRNFGSLDANKLLKEYKAYEREKRSGERKEEENKEFNILKNHRKAREGNIENCR